MHIPGETQELDTGQHIAGRELQNQSRNAGIKLEEGVKGRRGVGGSKTSKEWSGSRDEMDRKLPLRRRATDCACVC